MERAEIFYDFYSFSGDKGSRRPVSCKRKLQVLSRKKNTAKFRVWVFFFFKLVVEDIFVSSIVTLDLSMEIRSPTYQQEEGIGGP